MAVVDINHSFILTYYVEELENSFKIWTCDMSFKELAADGKELLMVRFDEDWLHKLTSSLQIQYCTALAAEHCQGIDKVSPFSLT